MGFVEAVVSVFWNYVNFRDRACRSEYWWFFLFMLVMNLVLDLFDSGLGFHSDVGLFGLLVTLVTILPGMAVGVRRLHDIDRTGWWLLLYLIPLIGAVIIFIWASQRGTPGTNRFGPDPLGGEEEDAAWEG